MSDLSGFWGGRGGQTRLGQSHYVIQLAPLEVGLSDHCNIPITLLQTDQAVVASGDSDQFIRPEHL